MSNINPPSRQKVLVIGFDGATYDLIKPLADQGLMPTFQRIMKEGVHGPLESVIPPLTGPAWTSFMTGKNPGKHALYDFVIRSPRVYTGMPINASQRDGESIWSIISRAGKQVGVFLVPVTYPPEQVNGFMVTGMLTPAQATDFTYPQNLVADLQAAVPGFDMAPEGTTHPLGREGQLLTGLDRMSTIMIDSTRYLMNRFSNWDFYMLVFKETDVAMHWLWRFMDASHPWYVQDADPSLRQGLQNVYRRMDECLAELLKMVGEDTLVILMSDHGAGPLDTYFHVNTWLVEKGFIQLKRDPATQAKRMLHKLGVTPISLYKMLIALRQGKQVAQTMRTRKKTALSFLRRVFLSFDNVDWSTSRAYSLGNYGQIYVNLKGRESQGIVNPGAEYEQVISELKAHLETLTDPRTGQPIQGHIYRKEEIYHGSHLGDAPDLVFLPDDLRLNGFGMYQFSSKSWLEPTFDRSGGHRMDGIMALYGPGIKAGLELSDTRIIDLAPTILASMGIPIPDDMDGRVLTEAFVESYFSDRPIKYEEARAATAGEKLELSQEDEEEIKERLRALGYIA
jgi:predicted AlkP superfamily phosphohydrolase/phosphomutase